MNKMLFWLGLMLLALPSVGQVQLAELHSNTIPEPDTSPPLSFSPDEIQRSQVLVIKSVDQTISGNVTDGETGDPLPGVNVLAKGTTTGTVTDISGNYRLTVDDKH